MRDFRGNQVVAQVREYTDADHELYLAYSQVRRDMTAAPPERALTVVELVSGIEEDLDA